MSHHFIGPFYATYRIYFHLWMIIKLLLLFLIVLSIWWVVTTTYAITLLLIRFIICMDFSRAKYSTMTAWITVTSNFIFFKSLYVIQICVTFVVDFLTISWMFMHLIAFNWVNWTESTNDRLTLKRREDERYRKWLIETKQKSRTRNAYWPAV